MSIHPSLNTSKNDKKSRSVLKRTERIKKLVDEDKWEEGQNIFGLPKLKATKMKAIKKEKAAPAEAATPEAAETKESAPAAEKKPAKP